MRTSVSNTTPWSARPLISDRTISLGSRNSGIPYARTPPSSWRASNTVTPWPIWIRSPAQASPAGPDPMTAILLPVGGVTEAACLRPRLRSSSATNLSRCPIAMGRPFLPRTHASSHWLSCGQTLPHTAGSALSSRMMVAAPEVSPTATSSMKSLILMPTGHPSTHTGRLHSRHRDASSVAISVS